MKIEKGKLYLYKESNILFKSDITTDNYPSGSSDKIAVHCPTKEDWEYVVSKGYELTSKWCGVSNYGLYSNTYMCLRLDYHRITIDQFKEFYPESNKGSDNNVTPDPINPVHYNQYAIQPIDYIEANGFNFNEGNVIKYVSRYKQKNGIEDLKKARVYLDRLINNLEKQK